MDNVRLLEEMLGLLKNLNKIAGVPEGKSIEEKNVSQRNSPSDPNKKTSSSLTTDEIKRTKQVATLFAEVWNSYSKKKAKDTKPQTLVSKLARQQTPPKLPSSEKQEGGGFKKGMFLAGLLALVGGVGALIMGLLNGGPLQGALKLISKIGIQGGLKLIMSSAGTFVKLLGKLVAAPFKAIGKLFSKGTLFKSLGKFLKPVMKVLKKVPFIGSVISIGFAISRFMKGDVTGGVIDLLSAFTGLLNLLPGGAFIAVPLAIGLDVLNAVLDAKMDNPENKGKSKSQVLFDMAKDLGKWIWDRSLYLPILGGIKRFGMAYDAFKSGSIGEGFKQLGLGLITFIGGGPIIYGFEMLMGMFDSDKEEQKELKSDKSWFLKVKDWIKSKLQNLPSFLRKPLEWFGILDSSDGSSEGSGFANAISAGYENVKNFVGPIWDGLKENFSKFGTWVSEKFSGIGEFFSNAYESIKNGLTSIGSWISEKFTALSGFISDAFEPIKNAFIKVKDYVMDLASKIGGWVKNLWPFGGGDDSKESSGLSDSDKQNKAKQAGWDSWEEYKNSGWQFKSTAENVAVSGASATKGGVMDQLLEINIRQHNTLDAIRNINYAIFKEMQRMSGTGGGSSNTPPIVMNSSGNKPTSENMALRDNRIGYTTSPYALA